MPLHKYPIKIWDALKLKQGIYTRLPKHYLKSLEQKEPTPVHWRPLGVQYRANPKTGQKERVQDVPIPIYYPPESQNGLWGGEGWISGFRYAKNDKVSLQEEDLLVLKYLLFTHCLHCKCESQALCIILCLLSDILNSRHNAIVCLLCLFSSELSLCLVVHSSEEDLETTAVQKRAVQ